MQIPGMFKPIIRQLLSDVSVKFDADAKTVKITKGDQSSQYTFDEIEAMINNGKLDFES